MAVTLAYSDPPAHPNADIVLINDLDLSIIRNGAVVVPGPGVQTRDRLNNVERALIVPHVGGM